MSTERWGDTDSGTTKVLGEKFVTVPICPSKSHVDWRGIEGRSPRLEAGDLASESWHCSLEV